MKDDLTVFYSWQSDLSKTRNKIESAIKKAIKVVEKLEVDFELEVNFDRDTKGKTGSPDIAQTILQKISLCDIFICDITPINYVIGASEKSRLVPNPNVLIELGFAINQLGWERVICVSNAEHGEVEKLPFDVRSHRVYTIKDESTESSNALAKMLATEIRNIQQNYHEISSRHNEFGYAKHDKEIFSQVQEIYSEDNLKDDAEVIGSALFSNDYQYQQWRLLKEFYQKSLNHFLTPELHTKFELFLKALEKFSMHCKINLKIHRPAKVSLIQMESEGVEITDEIRWDVMHESTYFAHKEPYQGETHDDSDKRIWKLQQELIALGIDTEKKYSEFILAYKKLILVE